MEVLLDLLLPDLLHMLRHRLRSLERERYFVETQVWAAIVPHQKKQDRPPELPAILKA